MPYRISFIVCLIIISILWITGLFVFYKPHQWASDVEKAAIPTDCAKGRWIRLSTTATLECEIESEVGSLGRWIVDYNGGNVVELGGDYKPPVYEQRTWELDWCLAHGETRVIKRVQRGEK